MRFLRVFFGRIVLILLSIFIEVMIVLSVFRWAGPYAGYIEAFIRVIGAVFVLNIIRNSRSVSSDLIWILLINLVPIPGTIIYMLMRGRYLADRTYRALNDEAEKAKRYYSQSDVVLDEMKWFNTGHSGQFQYLSGTQGFPFYRNDVLKYYPMGDLGYPRMLEELEKAKEFIFLEFFIIGEGVMWENILSILERKASEGVDVRVIYDDVGSFFTLPGTYDKELEARGIKCISFNRVHPVLNSIMNRRDHRKIMIVDGVTAFTGGINLADEYINVKERFGKWKDNVAEIKGEAVWSMTVMFLTHWNSFRAEDEDYYRFRKNSGAPSVSDGYVCAYCDSPLDDERVSQDVCQGILGQAVKYCYFFTPYLIVDNELQNALEFAAQRGVDVRIITPGIPDKRIVWYITRSYYKPLLEKGVKIYEYSPGFLHSKVTLCDDKIATVGTVNLDYRSMYFQFENSLYLYGCSAVKDVKTDFSETLSLCREITMGDCDWGIFKDFLLSCLRVFAPLL